MRGSRLGEIVEQLVQVAVRRNRLGDLQQQAQPVAFARQLIVGRVRTFVEDECAVHHEQTIACEQDGRHACGGTDAGARGGRTPSAYLDDRIRLQGSSSPLTGYVEWPVPRST